MTLTPWFAQPDEPIGTAVLLPGRVFGVATPLLHWAAVLLTERGWSVLGAEWHSSEVATDAVAHVVDTLGRARAQAETARPGLPVVVVAKSLGTLALPAAVAQGLPGAWLTPLTESAAILAAASAAAAPTLLVGGTADGSWVCPSPVGANTTVLEVPGGDHGLQVGDWRRSLSAHERVFAGLDEWAAVVEASTGAAAETSQSGLR